MRAFRNTCLFALVMVSIVATASSASVMDRVKQSMNEHHAVTFTIPASARGLWQTMTDALRNRSGITIRIPPIPIISNLWKTTNSTTSSSSSSSAASDADPITSDSISVEAPSSPVSPFKTVAQQSSSSDWCGGNILLDLTSRKEFTYRSSGFPSPQSSPYACAWDVKVSRNCRRGRITMTLDDRSRLADETRCSRGYIRVSPFMKEAKLCGKVGTLPPFQWYVDNTKSSQDAPLDVSIIMKNIGLNDGQDEGVAFTLAGECLTQFSPADSDWLLVRNAEASSRWMSTVEESASTGVTLYAASMAFQPVSKLSAEASEKISTIGSAAEDRIVAVLAVDPEPSVNRPKMTFFSPLYLLFRKFTSFLTPSVNL